MDQENIRMKTSNKLQLDEQQTEGQNTLTVVGSLVSIGSFSSRADSFTDLALAPLQQEKQVSQ